MQLGFAGFGPLRAIIGRRRRNRGRWYCATSGMKTEGRGWRERVRCPRCGLQVRINVLAEDSQPRPRGAIGMNIYWFQFDHESDHEGLVTVLVDAISMSHAKEILVAHAEELAIPLESNEQYNLVEYAPDEIAEDPRWLEQLRRLARVPRLTILTRRDMTDRYGLAVADPGDQETFARTRAEFLRRASQ